MGTVRNFPLTSIDSGSAAVKFLFAETIEEFDTPLVVVQCKVSFGDKKERGLRLDLDKAAFIDSLENEEADHAIAKAAFRIVSYLGTARYQFDRI